MVGTKPNNFGSSKYRTRTVFEPPLYEWSPKPYFKMSFVMKQFNISLFFYFLGGTLLSGVWMWSATAWDICTQNTTPRILFKNTDPYRPSWNDCEQIVAITTNFTQTFLSMQKFLNLTIKPMKVTKCKTTVTYRCFLKQLGVVL